MEVYLVRHTTPDIASGICYGQSDISLAKTFEKEKNKVLSQLPSDLDIIYTSPLERCSVLSKSINCPRIVTDPQLTEMNFGKWEMKKWDDIDHNELNNWMKNYIEIAPPNGENFLKLQKRVNAFWKTLPHSPFKKVAVVTHGGVIKIIMGIIQDTDLNKIMDFRIAYGQVIKVNI